MDWPRPSARSRSGRSRRYRWTCPIDGSRRRSKSTAYYVVAEALTNVAKYAPRASISVTARHDGEALLVEVRDDGPGGAAAYPGSGLQGLEDRVAAIRGRLSVDSPPGGGTTIRAVIPCA